MSGHGEPPADLAGAIRWAADRIGGATARLDSELLLAHQMGVPRGTLLLEIGRKPNPSSVPRGTLANRSGEKRYDADTFAALVDRRAGGEPIAYITGEREFWGLPIRVTPDVLIPRPDSETLIEVAIRELAGPPRRVLDLGTGSGALLLASLTHWPDAWGLGTDRSPAALAVARANAAALGLAGRAAFARADWAAALRPGVFDLVLANPPYVGPDDPIDPAVRRFEPSGALFAGESGLADIHAIVDALPALLARGGVGAVEIGSGQGHLAAEMARARGLEPRIAHDLAGLDRVLVVRSPD